MNGKLSRLEICRTYIHKIVICPELEADSNDDIAAFEETFTPMNKYCGFAKYDFNSKADEARACDYSHAHFLLNRYLTACVRHMLDAGIDLSPYSDFCVHIKESVEEKLEVIIAHEMARRPARACAGR